MKLPDLRKKSLPYLKGIVRHTPAQKLQYLRTNRPDMARTAQTMIDAAQAELVRRGVDRYGNQRTPVEQPPAEGAAEAGPAG